MRLGIVGPEARLGNHRMISVYNKKTHGQDEELGIFCNECVAYIGFTNTTSKASDMVEEHMAFQHRVLCTCCKVHGPWKSS